MKESDYESPITRSLSTPSACYVSQYEGLRHSDERLCKLNRPNDLIINGDKGKQEDRIEWWSD